MPPYDICKYGDDCNVSIIPCDECKVVIWPADECEVVIW